MDSTTQDAVRQRELGAWADKNKVTDAKVLAGIVRHMAKGLSVEEAAKKVFRQQALMRKRQLGPELYEQMKAEGKFPNYYSARMDMNTSRIAERLARSMVGDRELAKELTMASYRWHDIETALKSIVREYDDYWGYGTAPIPVLRDMSEVSSDFAEQAKKMLKTLQKKRDEWNRAITEEIDKP